MTIHWFTRYLTEYYSKNKKIGLDIGCGKRPYDKYFQCNYIGMDLPLNLAKKNGGGITYPEIFGIGKFLPFLDNSFDFVSCYSVLPYEKDVNKFFSEIFRIIKPTGVAVIIIMNLKGLSLHPDTDYPTKYNSSQLNKKLNEHGFRSLKLRNPKALFFSTYFDLTSVYSYAIVSPKK